MYWQGIETHTKTRLDAAAAFWRKNGIMPSLIKLEL